MNAQYKRLTDIEKEHWKNAINWAIEDIINNGYPNKSTGYNVIYKKSKLPPKGVIQRAFDYLDNNNIETSVIQIKGGEDTNTFLQSFGFSVYPKILLKDLITQIDIWEEWRKSYERFVPLFIQEAATGKEWKEWNQEVFYEFFEKAREQCIASMQQGYFSNDEKEKIKENWHELAPLLQILAQDQNYPYFDIYKKIKDFIRKYTIQNKKAASNRLIASLQPQFLSTIVNEDMLKDLYGYLNLVTDDFELKYSGDWFQDSFKILSRVQEASGIENVYEIVTIPWQLYELLKNNTDFNLNRNMSDPNNEILNLLKYKKQIILQGPPGTGKTREAKKIAEELTGNNSKVSDLKQYFKVGQKINSTSGIASYYDVLEVHANKITIKNEKAVENREISLETINDTISQINTGQVDKSRVNYSYESALASYIIKEVKSNDQIKLIQFHPSFTYEDFVRGIVSKPNDDGDGIVYEAENKLLADFAKKAFDNYKEANKTNVVFSKETSVFDAFIESIKDELAQNENHKYDITEAVYLFSADETRFKYKGDNWVAHSKGLNMKFSELKKIIDLGATERQDIKKMIDVEELTRQHATYFIKIVEKYYDFKKTYKESNPTQARAELKNYVLIIDEINRANLSSVLGELIYALEYRGESVESMYEVDGHELILPPNLYIIGTMNTADRSVGHIDYAIRRRFAFVDVLPKDLSEEDNISFDAELFYSVEKLFDTNLSPEFEKKDVQLGHSYFIDKSKDGGSMDIRLEYEIKPILLEYVKDGVLIGGDIKKLIDDLEPSI